ncbi:MAG TPA: penicillin acylase family protein, partial [Candidatus Baltobacteraceae bacterium]|nr:penicillin acylase family protein [Candidatus Baltobacteraceae bacterium]
RAGSNAWGVGALRSVAGRALLANDPHLELTIPGLWYLEEVRAPGMHVAGVAIPGVPGIVLGHNARIAWGATNADAADTSLFEAPRRLHGSWVREVFHVRFAHDVTRAYYRTAREFGVRNPYDGDRLVLVRWPPFARPAPHARSAITTFLALDDAGSVRQAYRVLSRYAGPAENFVVADTHGDVGYHVAGTVVDDRAWGRYVHASRDLGKTFAAIAFDRLPSTAPSRNAVAISANNKMYGAHYPYRLAPFFDPPYRAYRIAELLRERRRYDAAYFARMQLDVVSPVDGEFAHRIAAYAWQHAQPGMTKSARALGSWRGAFAPGSQAATVEHALRAGVAANEPSFYAVLQQLRQGDPSPNLQADVNGSLYYAGDRVQPWGRAGAVAIEHPLAPLRFGFLNGVTLPGAGDEYTIRLQEPGFAQSFRAVWDVGNWDGGGIVIPSGESGEPGSGHYTDLSAAWIAGRMQPLPFSARAVKADTKATLVLEP